MRNKDAHIISVDRYTFIQDARFATWHEAVTNTWTLQVKYVQASDAGRYECQVSTEPKMSHFVHLNVVGEYECFYFFLIVTIVIIIVIIITIIMVINYILRREQFYTNRNQ